MSFQRNIKGVSSVYIFLGSSSIAVPRIIILEYVWPISAKSCHFANSLLLPPLWAFSNS